MVPPAIEAEEASMAGEEKKTFRKPLSEVIALITEKLESEGLFDACIILLTVPCVIPVISIGSTTSRNYELGKLLEWIAEHFSDPCDREPLGFYNFADKFRINHELIEKVDKELAYYSWTRDEILEAYGLSPALYDYLIHLKFSHSNRLERVFLKYPYLLHIIHFIGISFLYPTCIILGFEAFMQKFCSDNVALNQEIYHTILQSFRNETHDGTLYETGMEEADFEIPYNLTISTSDLCQSMINGSYSRISQGARFNVYDYPDAPFSACAWMPFHVINVTNQNPLTNNITQVRVHDLVRIAARDQVTAAGLAIVCSLYLHACAFYLLKSVLSQPRLANQPLCTRLLQVFYALASCLTMAGFFLVGW